MSKQNNTTTSGEGKKNKIEALLSEKKRLRKLYHQPIMRRNNGKPTSEAFDLYGKRIYKIEAEIYKLNQP